MLVGFERSAGFVRNSFSCCSASLHSETIQNYQIFDFVEEIPSFSKYFQLVVVLLWDKPVRRRPNVQNGLDLFWIGFYPFLCH